MTSPEQAQANVEDASSVAADQSKSRSRRGPGKRSGKGGEGTETSRPKQRNDRFSLSVFGDGIERAFCTRMASLLPVEFPVNHRTGLAVIAPIAVAKTPGRILLCDCQHRGQHAWPDGDLVESASAQNSPNANSPQDDSPRS